MHLGLFVVEYARASWLVRMLRFGLVTRVHGRCDVLLLRTGC